MEQNICIAVKCLIETVSQVKGRTKKSLQWNSKFSKIIVVNQHVPCILTKFNNSICIDESVIKDKWSEYLYVIETNSSVYNILSHPIISCTFKC